MFLRYSRWVFLKNQPFLILSSFLSHFKRATPRNNNKKDFAFICCKFLANLCKFSEILEQCHIKWWLKYRSNWLVSWTYWTYYIVTFIHVKSIKVTSGFNLRTMKKIRQMTCRTICDFIPNLSKKSLTLFISHSKIELVDKKCRWNIAIILIISQWILW